MNPLEHILERLPDVFTPAKPISDVRFLRGRILVREQVDQAMHRKGASIVLFGERGVGKSSVAKIVAQFAPGNPYYYAVSKGDTFESVCASLLDYYGVSWRSDGRTTSKSKSRGLQLRIDPIGASVASQEGDSQEERVLVAAQLTPQQVAQRLPGSASLVIVDEFERIANKSDRAAFADLIKKLSDNESNTTLMVVGIAENIDELLAAHESAERSIAEVHVDRLTNAEISEIVHVGLSDLGIAIGADQAEQMMTFSARSPYYTHLLCEGAVRSLVARVDGGKTDKLEIGEAELAEAIEFAIRTTRQSISNAYTAAVRNLRDSPRFKYTLYAIASWPDDPVPYGEICKWVGHLVGAPSGQVNVSHQLKRLESLEIIKRPCQGFYTFENPLLKAYVILRARADTTANELRAIDAQLREVGKRLDRVRNRV